MDAVTYPDDAVITFINRNLVPLRIPSDRQPLADEYEVAWTPALFILDQEGHTHQATVGFFSPEEFIPSLLLGIGNMYFHKDDFTKALDHYAAILADHADSDAVPEALFHTGVARYKSSGDPKPLKEAYQELAKEFPESTWTKRAYPYRLIQ
ncbi:MAG TPA: tetratricopeptide repeat protein [Desulfobulbaceae bacterium]|nr:tetratricopeptide repeat protein [Desulfobulbaceae bacterium]